MKTRRKYLTVLLICLCTAAIFIPRKAEHRGFGGHPRDYGQIAAEGTIRAVTEYNFTGYYVDGDTLSGFHYELMQAFARDHNLKCEFSAEMAFDRQLKGLAEGEYDLIAHGILATSTLKDSLLLTVPIMLNRPVLVQRRNTAVPDSQSLAIRSQLELAGKTVHVVKNSPYILRIHNLGREIGDTIYIREIEKYGAEQLISLVAHGSIDYAVCDENTAASMADSLPQIDASIAVGFTQFHAWAVSKQSPALLDSLDRWLETYKKSTAYRKLCRKYGLSPCI